MSKRALLLLNPKARQGQTAPLEGLAKVQEAGIELIEVLPPQPGTVSDVIRAHADKVDMVIIGGGDGSLNAAAEGLIETQLPLGILPLGTANDLARTLEIPLDLSSACEVITQGQTRRIDLGWVNGKHFFNVASLGLSVQIASQLTREVKSRWGVLAYTLTAFRVFLRSRPFHAEIVADGQTWRVRTLQIAVGNGRHYGGGMTVNQEAAIDDGVLHLYSLEVDRWWQVVPLLPALRLGSLNGSTSVRTLQGREFEVRALSRPRLVNADGEIVGQTPCRFRLVPQAISVFVPAPKDS
jgi:diacylglycerol kinase (ATP)